MKLKTLILIVWFYITLGILIGYGQVLRIHFPHNSDTPNKTDLQALKKTVQENTNSTWTLEARTSSSGSENHNMGLSQKRMHAVSQQLKSYGINVENISSSFVGESMANQNIDDENDRVVLVHIQASSIAEKEQGTAAAITKVDSLRFEVQDALEKRSISGTYWLNGKSTSFSHSFTLQGTSPSTIKISSTGYKDSSITIKQASGIIKVELWPENVVEKLVFENIYFYPNRADILPESNRALEQLYEQLKGRTDVLIEIRGHINWPRYLQSQSDANLAMEHQLLSNKRAYTVMTFLIKKGIPKEILSFKGMSNSQMLYPDAETEGQMAYNRRVEIILLKKP